jgi:hypothetical protein
MGATFNDSKVFLERRFFRSSLRDCNSSDGELNCYLRIGFKRVPAAGDLLELQIGPFSAEQRIADNTFRWSDRKATDGKSWHLAVSEAQYPIEQIDWLMLSDAQILQGSEGYSLIRFAVTNPTDRMSSIGELVLSAAAPKRSRCATGVDPVTTVTLNWEK